jgi:hypothetical protein
MRLPPFAFNHVPAMPATLSPTPFKPSFSAEQLADLQATLAHSKLPKATFQSLDPANGITHPWMESTLAYWQNGFDWKKREEHINSVDHFKVPIVDDDGRIYSVHYVGHFSSDPAAIPLLLLHGWPVSRPFILPSPSAEASLNRAPSSNLSRRSRSSARVRTPASTSSPPRSQDMDSPTILLSTGLGACTIPRD